MNRKLHAKLNQYAKTRKTRRKWLTVVASLCAVVAVGTSYLLINPAITQQQETYCGFEEHKEHVDTCYEKVLVCQLPEEGHIHSESCYEEKQVLTCSLCETDGHHHGEDCYETERVLICNDTNEEHIHTDECYEDRDILTCQLEECEPHHHDDSCFETQTVYTCGMEECDPHWHSEECYEIDYDNLTCELPIHEHTLQCFSNPAADLETADIWERTFNGVELTGNWNKDVIAIAETQLGYTESTANYEVQEDGTTMKGYTRYGDWYGVPYGDWCAMFCSFCIDYAGVTDYPLEANCKNWIMDLGPDADNPDKMVYYHEAGTYTPKPGDLIFFDWDAVEEQAKTGNHGNKKNSETPTTPDENVVDQEALEQKISGVDHVGLVYELEKDENGVPVKLVTIEGNYGNKVSRVEYLPDNKTILGYGEMIENPDYADRDEEPVPETEALIVPDCDCGSPNAELLGHSDKCARKAFLMDLCKDKSAVELHDLWKQLPEDMKVFALTYLSWIDNAKLNELNALLASDPIEAAAADGGVSAAITGVFPADTVAVLQDLDESSDELVKNYIENELGNIGGGVFSGAIDIGLYENGEKLDLNGETVSVAVGGFDFGGLWGDDLLVRAYHLKDTDAADLETLAEADPEIEVLPAQVDENGNIVFETDGFSVIYFTVDFHYLDGTYNLPGGENMLLSELFAALGLDFDPALIESVEFSDSGLLEVAEVIGEDGVTVTDWELSSTIPFGSQESLTVTFVNGQVLRISVTDEQVEATYWQRVNASNLELNTTNYLIVSAEGNYALTYGSSSPYSTKVSLVPVKGNPGYYTVDGVTGAMKWTIRSGGYIRNVGSTRYRLSMSSSTAFFGTSDVALTRTYNATTGTWTIANGSYYLRYSDGTFSRSNSGTYQRSMIILKQVDTTLNIPDDVTGGSGSGGESGTEIIQPSYTPDTDAISGAKQGDISNVAAVVPNAGETISGAYASDPSTSQIEDQFFSTVQGEISPTVNDGKVLTDKSVIYGDDDYGAFNSYDEGTFGVTLSVLGQDYQLKTADRVKIPVDVVFVLDVSGSMGNAAGNVTRSEAVVNAVNSAMTQIMNDNPENRAGVVLYSSGGSTLLGLDHYTAGSNNQYLNYNNSKIRTASNLSGTKSGTIPQTYGEVNGFTQSHGTYTQYGIALGAKLLQDNSDTTYTTMLNAGTDYAKQVTVTRQPVIILLSDGDPTHCTSNYTDVLSGPAYGDGVYPSTTNNKGIQGYYTILSANYYKRMVGIHYNVPASFYTIGMGIYDGSSENKYKDMSGASSTGDCYKRAVLNPTAANVSDLLSDGARNTNPNSKYSAGDTWSISCQMLNQLLGSDYDDGVVTVGSTSSYSNIGTTNTKVPVLSNPYSGNYSYADGAYFGNLNTTDLQSIFGKIISGNLNVKSYGYMLFKGTSVDINDEIGAGMEIKGDPVLRYNGQCYPLTKVGSGDTYSYVCNATATTTDGSGVNNTQRTVDLSGIEITVTTANGIQSISMRIPESAVPSYTPETTADWYYEQLPVRLIYQVGLTDDAKTAVKNLAPGETLTYYTNAWENTSAESTQSPHQDNPYYNNVTYDDGTSRTKQYNNYSTDKTENTTGTASTSAVSEEKTSPDHEIAVKMGNNGKLLFTNTGPSAVSVTLKKVDMSGKTIVTSPAEFKLYSDAELEHLIGTYTTENGVLTIPDLHANTPYYLKETKAPDGYYKAANAQEFWVNASGDVEGISPNMYFQWDSNNDVLLVYNSDGYELPETGGRGLFPIYALGAVLIAGSLMYGCMLRRRRERRTE